MLSPHTFLLGILFYNNAFRAPRIRSIGDLRRLFLESDRQQIEIPLKPEKSENYIFCKIKGIKGLIKYHYNQPISKRLVSNAQQNLIIKYTDIRTFLNHYLPRRIGTDIQSLIQGLEPDSAIIRARPRKLTDKQKASVEEDSKLKEAIKKRDIFSKKLYQDKKKITNTRNRLFYNLRKYIQEEFDSQQAVTDIKRQLAEGILYKQETKEILLTEEHILPKQISLLEKLTT
ncbi:hypothetical protein N7509_011476 [Penicillium cosmopolitanum]|uniref:Uncharacterized protein n=1 Tax=Penicillium cosmopolitanum TaxID=1131564 RepID=A0A9W9VDV4_9EURO|nr:uncharacterized protein N7509_011476 [Penicillium cosmopolitanum]KAJ5378357.1 hypothetical protein N7509_011476 [Penicillium cosmopolitanum]